MKRYLALVFALLFVLALFAGCGGNNNTANKTTNNNSTDKGAAATDNSGTASPEATDDEDSPYKFAAGKFPADANGIATAKYEYELPLTTTDETFTYWTTNFTPEYLPEEGYGATALPMEVEARTGVKVEYIVVASAARAENFSVLAASTSFATLPATRICSTQVISETLLKQTNSLLMFSITASTCQLMYEATRDPDDIDTIRTVFTEDDLVLLVYELKKEGQLTSGGFMRGDWLAKMGKTYTDIVTFDDLHEVLMFFKSQLGIATPTSIYKTINVVGCNEWVGYDTYALCSGVPQSVVVNGKVQLANMTQNDLDLMTMINQWYNDGIIDPNWSSYTGCADLNDKIKSSEVGYILAGGISIAAHDDVIPRMPKWAGFRLPCLFVRKARHCTWAIIFPEFIGAAQRYPQSAKTFPLSAPGLTGVTAKKAPSCTATVSREYPTSTMRTVTSGLRTRLLTILLTGA